jgi:hypothetical protein
MKFCHLCIVLGFFATEKLGKVAVLLTYILEIPSSNLDWDTNFPRDPQISQKSRSAYKFQVPEC